MISIGIRFRSKSTSGSSSTSVSTSTSSSEAIYAAKAGYAEEAGYASTAGKASSATYATTAGALSEAGLETLTDDLSEQFLSSVDDDTAKGEITFAAGVKFGDGTNSITASGDATLNDIVATMATLSGDLSVSGTTTTAGISNTGDIQNTGDLRNTGDLTVGGDTSLQDVTTENIDNAETITTKDLTVTGTAHFFELVIDKVKAAGGAVMFTPADGFTILRIDEVEDEEGTLTGWKLYWLATDSDGNSTVNMWQTGDQALCMNFNQATAGTSYDVSNTYWWRLVTAASTDDDEDGAESGVETVELTIGETTAEYACHWIVVSAEDCDTDSAEPQVGDAVVMCGNRYDEERQTAIYISAYSSLDPDLDAPLYAHYMGIDDFDLSSHRKTYFDRDDAEFVGNFTVSSGQSLEEYVAEKVSEESGAYAPYIDDSTKTWWVYQDGQWVDSGVSATVDLSDLTRVLYIDLSMGGQIYADETETVTLSVWDVLKLNEYTDSYTYKVERDSGDESDDAVWNAESAHLSCGSEFTISYEDLNIPARVAAGSVATLFYVTATATDGTVETATIAY